MDIDESISVQCPYCWQWASLHVERTGLPQEYVEDCEVCCRPILFRVAQDVDGRLVAEAHMENE